MKGNRSTMAMKLCTKCNVTKGYGEYHKDKSQPDGCYRYCKDCKKRYYLTNKDLILARTKQYNLENKQRIAMTRAERYKYKYKYKLITPKVKETKRLWNAANREKMRASVRKSKLKYPVREKARKLVTNALVSGKLQRQPCIVCGDKGEAHHSDYNKPLDVDWLCRKHHSMWHRYLQPYNG